MNSLLTDYLRSPILRSRRCQQRRRKKGGLGMQVVLVLGLVNRRRLLRLRRRLLRGNHVCARVNQIN